MLAKNKKQESSGKTNSDTPAFFLSEGKRGDEYQIVSIKDCNRLDRLTDLGLIPGAHLTIVQRLASSFVVTVKICDISISPEITSAILVIPWKKNV
jgi:Fe2+ transport system protein FeoA